MAEEPFAPVVLQVRELTTRVRLLLEHSIGSVWVEGECSNLSRPASGHIYFTLKDEAGQIQAAWFKGRQGTALPVLKEGMKLRVHGLVTAYERGAQIQIRVDTVEDAGLGDLQKAFEALKQKLSAEGLFDPARKRPLPVLPRRIGLVTSPTGAAIRDILQVLNRRYPDRYVLVAPVKVQGVGAAQGIKAAIDYLNAEKLVDVIIVTRGGGSLEDLWCFNEEMVARAIAASEIPVISAVGHEIDFTISDFVADLRAPTPSAAAELVIGRKLDFEKRLHTLQRALAHAAERKRQELRARLLHASANRFLRDPSLLLSTRRQNVRALADALPRLLLARSRQPAQRLKLCQLRLQHAGEARLADLQRHLDELQQTLRREIPLALQQKRQTVQQRQRQLAALNPLAVLERGFSLTRGAQGQIIRSTRDVQAGQCIETITADGHFRSLVTEPETATPPPESPK